MHDRPAGSSPHQPSTAELGALADHAAQRLALYRRRMYLGRGETRRFDELERRAKGARDRFARARATDARR
jgi:hypothetical protein